MKRLALLCSVAALTGCTQHTVNITTVQTNVGVRPGVQQAAPQAQHPVENHRLVINPGKTEFALAGQGFLTADCHEMPGASIRILMASRYGATTVRNTPVAVTFPPGNPRSACNGQMHPVPHLVYFRKQGFTGTDELAYQVVSPDGEIWPYHYTIDAR